MMVIGASNSLRQAFRVCVGMGSEAHDLEGEILDRLPHGLQ